jgi:hypothetical protein
MALSRFYYSGSFAEFFQSSDDLILGQLTASNQFSLLPTQRDAWTEQLRILRTALDGLDGTVVFEFAIPRMGSRIDVVLIVRHVVFIVEFKVGSDRFDAFAIDQVYDYALDLHYFHEPSHVCNLVPVLIATSALPAGEKLALQPRRPCPPMRAAPGELRSLIESVLDQLPGEPIDAHQWLDGRYSPTPTIVEAATALYRGHSVQEISRSDAGGRSLAITSDAVTEVIQNSRDGGKKSICFVTGVPGAGKTLVGLNIANQHTDKTTELYSVFLSGNGPLVDVLREALARDAVAQARDQGVKKSKGEARAGVKQFIQNVHHFRDECLRDTKPPIEHVALFDEAQRAWNLQQTVSFMTRKKNQPNFSQSEPAFLVSCLDRHPDWATVVCLVGGGQEINTGEGGIQEWIDALVPCDGWQIHVSPNLKTAEFSPGESLAWLERMGRVTYDPRLHLFASMRAFRAEQVSELVRALLEFEVDEARRAYAACADLYPVALTRSVETAKAWVRQNARGSERFGVVVSSAAERLRPLAMHVKAPMDPVHWFLDGKEDVRSSYYMEDIATEFQIQGLELDWTCVTWDADFRYSAEGWQHFNFVGSRWNRVNKPDRRRYQKNAYRVLLTRARQGMVILVPEGDPADPTRSPEFYDSTFDYLRRIGFQVV